MVNNLELSPELARVAPRTLLAHFEHAYQTALDKSGSLTYAYRIAGCTVRLVFAGPALAPLLTPALAHLACPEDVTPDLTFYLWDGASTGVVAPWPWSAAEIELRGEVPAYSDDTILTAVQPDVNAVSIFDRSRAVGFYWIDHPGSLRAYERAAPLKVLLHWGLRERGCALIHAGAIGNAAGAVLIVGKTGAGKSTTTLACLNAGLSYLSDDRCLLSLTPRPQVYCIYNSAKLHLAQMTCFPTLLAQVNNLAETVTEKALLYLHEVAPRQLAHALPIRAILLAKVAGTLHTTLSPLSRMALLRDFVTSTLVYQPGAVQAEVAMMTALVRQTPCYQLNLGSDLAGIPPVVEQAIDAAQ